MTNVCDIRAYLDNDKRSVVESRLDRGGIGVTVGPPGVGKTIGADAEALLAHFEQNQASLMVALGNMTVDEMAWALYRIYGDEARKIAVRTGNKAAVDPNLPLKFESDKSKILTYPIVLTTLHSCKWLPRGFKADRLIVDETGIETLEQILMPIPYVVDDNTVDPNYDPFDLVDLLDTLGITMSSIGDPFQAKPISPKFGDPSAIEYFMKRCGNMTLKTTYRLPHPLDIIVDEFAGYGGLRSAPSVRDRRLALEKSPNHGFKSILCSDPLVTFLDTNGVEKAQGLSSWSNPIEAKCVAKLCQEAERCLSSHSIMALSRYTAQRFEINNLLRSLGISDIEARTTTQALGTEKNLVIFSLTRNNEYHELGATGALEDLNVAISRAQCKLVIVGNFEMLEDGWIYLPNVERPGRRSPSRRLANLIERYGQILPVPACITS